MAKYCSNRTCEPSRTYFSDDEEWCSKCREELTPCIRCLCGKEEVNPRQMDSMKACRFCGARLTDDYLGRCMAVQFGGMVREIATTRGEK